MKVKKYAIKMLKNDMKQSVFLVMAITLTTTVIFNIFNIIYNSSLLEFQNDYKVMFDTITFLLLGVAVFITFFASSFFLLSKSKELGIGALCGLGEFDLAKILLLQSNILIIIGIVIGISLGIILSPVFLSVIFKATNINANIFNVSRTGLYITIAIVVLIGLYLVAFNLGYVYKQELIELINLKKQVDEKDKRIIKIPKPTYLITYLVVIFIPFIPFMNISDGDSSVLTLAIISIGLYGMQGVVRRYIPYKILELKKKYFFSDKIALISLSNVYNSIINTMPVVIVLTIGSTLLISMVGINAKVPAIKVICIFAYTLITILIAISIIYKVLLEAYNKRGNYVQLRLIGYTKKQIIDIIGQESIIFNSLIIGVPMIYIIFLLIMFINSGVISFMLASILFGIFIISYLSSGIISFFGYKKMIINYVYRG